MNVIPALSRARTGLRHAASRRHLHAPTPNPKLIMTILAKNEADIIEKHLIFHKDMGVDGFVVTDNNSTDGTREIFEKYMKKGWILEIIDEPVEDYSQADWVDRMIRRAIEAHGADWVINADADEFWAPRSGSLKTEISASRANVILCPIYNVLPADEERFYMNTLMVKKTVDAKRYSLAKFNDFSVSIPKVMHRAEGYGHIHMGNHHVDMSRAHLRRSGDIVIYHYNIRSREHFKNKMLIGGAAYERNLKLGKGAGAHWRYFYEGAKAGTLDLDHEYDRFIGKELWEDFLRRGIVTEAPFVRSYFTHD